MSDCKQSANEELRNALRLCMRGMCGYCRMDAEARGMQTKCVNECEAVKIAKAALTEPPRNCDRFKSKYDADKLHEAFVKHCNECDCPMGCIHRRDTRCMLDTRCGSILKCFAEFVLSKTKGETDEQI